MEKRKKAANWLNREINCLLDLMLQKQVMKLFDDKKTRSCDIYKMLSREMKSSGYDRDEEQIKFKFVKLKTAYMKQLNNNKTSGHKREEDEFYDKMSQLLQTRPASAFRDSGFDSSSVQGTSDVESTSLDEVNEDATDPNESSIFRFTDSSTPTKTLKAQPPTKRGRSHDSSFNIFQLGKQASAGLKMFAEIGRTDNLELDERNQREKIYDEFTIPAINAGGGRSETNFFVDGNHSFVSLITRIVPSPDWFIGVDSFQLCVGGSWVDSVTVEMDPLDAGTDNGFTFTAPNWPTEPQGIIYRITSRYPAHPAGSFFYPNSKRLPPIATFQFIKLKEYELSEMFNHIEDDRKYETVKAVKNRLEIEHNHIEMNNELSADIEKERQHEVTQIPFRMTEKDKNRARILAKMKNEMNQTSNVIPKNDKKAILNNIAENYATSKPQQQRKRQRNKKGRPPKDCRVSHWSEWSPCSKTCGIGEMHRYRKVIKHARRGGRPCPPLQESKWCGSARDCNSASNYFKW